MNCFFWLVIGGRVKQAQPFDGFPPIDLGGEFIHGSDSIINKLAEENNWRVTPVSYFNIYFDFNLQ